MRNKGFTLIEVVLIIVVAAIAIPVLLVMMGEKARMGVKPEVHVTASNLAHELMEEIRSRRWDETPALPTTPLGPEGMGESKTQCSTGANTYDDIDDYNGYSETCTWAGVQYTRSVEVCYVPDLNLNDTASCNAITDYKRVRVIVSSAQAGGVELITLMTNH